MAPPVLRPLTRARATVFAGPDVDVPPRRRAVLAIFAMAIGSFAIGTSEFVTMGLLPDIADGLGVSIPQGGYLISAYAVGVVLGAPVIAAAGARMPRRRLLGVLMLFSAAANVLTAVAPGPVGVTAARLLAGLPHGAYFGVASLLAASLVLPERRGQAVSSVMLGLAAANVVGVPAATWLGQAVGWRSAYWTVSAIAVLCVLATAMLVPSAPGSSAASVRRELSALRRPQVWLTVLVGMIGFGGMFSMYSYIAPLITDVTGMSAGSIPLILLAFGVGGVLGTVAGGRAADRALVPSLVASLSLMVLLLAGLTVLAQTAIGITVGVFVIAFNGSVLVTCLQMRLMDVAGDARTLGAALNHASLNAANALGAWLGGLVIGAGLGLLAPSWVGAALAAGGLGVLMVSVLLERHTDQPT
ncbi:MAG: MFS transporter [Actinomycetota bacterium]|nr:MFS transporter [Actinomycetota bacterium]